MKAQRIEEHSRDLLIVLQAWNAGFVVGRTNRSSSPELFFELQTYTPQSLVHCLIDISNMSKIELSIFPQKPAPPAVFLI